MTASITTEVDLTGGPSPRIGVTLAGWSADGSVDVYRVHPDTSRHLVRGMSAVSGGAAFAWDYEAPFAVPVHYEADDASTPVSSANATLDIAETWVSVPGLPGYAVPVTLLSKPSAPRQRATTALRPMGRTTPIVLSDVLASPEFGMVVRTKTENSADDLEDAIAAAATLLVRIPGARHAWQYVAMTGVTPSPVVGYRAGTASAADVANWTDWALSGPVVDSPVGGVFGDPTASYQVLLDTYPTYAAMLAAEADYLDVLKGVVS